MMSSTAASPSWTSGQAPFSRADKLRLLTVLEERERLSQERERRRRERLRAMVQDAARRRVLTPETVIAFAALHMTVDDGRPMEPAAHHRLWLTLLCDRRIRRLLLIAPPESAKTSWVIAYLGCRIGIWPEDNVILGSVANSVAEARSLALRAMVLSDEWRLTFPGVLPVKAAAGGFTWETSRWTLAPGGKPRVGRLHPTISSYGVGGSVIGSRADEAIGDDLLDFDSTRTQAAREKDKTWAHNSLISRVKSRVGRVLIIGNQWHQSDMYGAFEDQGDFVVCRIGILSDTADVYAQLTYPDSWSGPMLGEPIGAAVAA